MASGNAPPPDLCKQQQEGCIHDGHETLPPVRCPYVECPPRLFVPGFFHLAFTYIKKTACSISKHIVKLFQDDRRRLIHSVKVGLALALVSLSVLLDDVFERLGRNTTWAVMTAVVIFEYTVGATLSKGLNRGFGTLVAAILGFSVDLFANMTGPIVQPCILGFSVFTVGALATFTRFFPGIKAKYDYGVMIFLLTFCLVVVSGYRVADSLDIVLDRIITVALGCFICLLISLFISPIWAGEDLHHLIASNFDHLAGSVEECVKEYFHGVHKLEKLSSKICKGEPHEDPIYTGYRKVLISKQTEESLANFASWEPRHGQFQCMHPWKDYLKVGAILRHCAYTVSALHGCLLSEIQAPNSLRRILAQPCINMSNEIGRLLRELGGSIRNKAKIKAKECMMKNLNHAVEQLQLSVDGHPDLLAKPTTLQADQEPTQILESNEHWTIEGIGGDNILDKPQTEMENTSSTTKIEANPVSSGKTDNNSRQFAQFLCLATVVSLLVEIVARLDTLVEAVNSLGENAGLKKGDEGIHYSDYTCNSVPVERNGNIQITTE